MADQQPLAIFVYGSLRPDDTSAQSWTESFLSGMIVERARIYNAALFHDQFACAVLGSQGQDGEHSITPLDFIEGWVVSTASTTNDTRAHSKAAAMFQLKLMQADKIEGYPHLYQRSATTAVLLKESQVGSNKAGSKQQVQAFIYHRAGCKRHCRIASGDWLKRDTPSAEAAIGPTSPSGCGSRHENSLRQGIHFRHSRLEANSPATRKLTRLCTEEPAPVSPTMALLRPPPSISPTRNPVRSHMSKDLRADKLWERRMRAHTLWDHADKLHLHQQSQQHHFHRKQVSPHCMHDSQQGSCQSFAVQSQVGFEVCRLDSNGELGVGGPVVSAAPATGKGQPFVLY
jgi:gamma-glutamylcyclotransferase (GGCT)/AIG2-like uncharacterized protein YtfP